ncbi:hypothetical protein L1987_02427 [Smallanthus sonchifolius]|uniref:Uncharacterized protein n=1 Tax=Smallanthus sonchifolius TaxID=185202 RepID=A0ACB9K7T5_9ASTR|nr:hypothetical protein L1987_02427 [Smallanthus sonchifolius]
MALTVSQSRPPPLSPSSVLSPNHEPVVANDFTLLEYAQVARTTTVRVAGGGDSLVLPGGVVVVVTCNNGDEVGEATASLSRSGIIVTATPRSPSPFPTSNFLQSTNPPPPTPTGSPAASSPTPSTGNPLSSTRNES